VAGPQNLRRVYNIRIAEERQLNAQMESALAKLRLLQNGLTAALKSAKQARALIVSSANTGEPVDRIAALQESRAAEHKRKVIQERIAAAEVEIASLRQEFLIKRIERRQVDSLLDVARARLEVEENRKSQSELDDWHLSQRNRKGKGSV
jgi:hypothetical protein